MFVIANWKMNPVDSVSARKLYTALRMQALAHKRIYTVLAPPVIFAQTLFKDNKSKRCVLGVQDISASQSGAHTGEISASQARSIKAQYTLVGHRERRNSGETNDDVRKKVFAALRAKMHPIVCIGELERDKDALFLQEIKEQVLSAFKEVPSTRIKDVILAYEPASAIGAREALSAHEIHQITLFIRKVLIQAYGASSARSVLILYGGAVDEYNVEKIVSLDGIGGVLLGRASLDADKFGRILSVIDTVAKKRLK